MATNDIARAPDKVRAVLPNLPRDLGGMQLPNKRGVWHRAGDFQALDALGSAFFDDSEVLGPEAFLSIPDVWAQVEAYRIALTSERQTAYSMFVGEWRGLLAVIALQQELGIQVTPEEYNFVTSQSPIATVLSAHPPRSRLGGKGAWDSVGLLRLRPLANRRAGVLIGLAVPSVIAVTAKSYRLELKEQLDQWTVSIPWLVPASEAGQPKGDGRHYFADPCDARFVGKIGMARYRILEAYLSGLSQNLRGMDGELAKVIKTRLDAFIADVRTCAGRGTVNLVPKKIYALPASIGLPDTFTLYEESREDKLKSDFRVPVRAELEEFFSGAIIIDLSIVNRLGGDGRSWRIWGTYTGADLQANPSIAKRIAEQIKADCDASENLRERPYLPIIGDDLFAASAVQIVNDTIVGESQGFRQFVYPLTALALVLCDPRQLQQAARIEQAGDRVTMTLALSCTRVDGRQSTIEMQREYSASKEASPGVKQVLEKKLPHTISLWPSVKLPGWTWNFGLYSGNIEAGGRVFVDGYVGPRSIRTAIQGEPAAKRATAIDKLGHMLRAPRSSSRQSPSPGGAGDVGWDRVELQLPEELTAGSRRELHRIYEYPEALLLQGPKRPGASAEGGMLLTYPKHDYSSAPLSSAAVVGIDFGTTNTAVYSSVDGGNPTPVRLNRRYWSPRGDDWGDDDDRGEALHTHNELFPWAGREVPFLTALRDRSNMIKEGPLMESPILAATIFLEPNANVYLDEILKQITGESIDTQLIFNLKWSSVNWDRRLSLYLSQLVLQTIIELLSANVNPGNIEWRFSYPEAFDPGKTRRFREQCQDMARRVYSALGDNLRPRGNGNAVAPPKVAYDKESVSAARFFVGGAGGVSNPGHVVTIDIGGGTADISIWYARKLIWRSSVQLAGKAILIDYVGRRRGILYDLLRAKGEAEALSLLDKAGKATSHDAENFKNAAEAVINSAVGSDLFLPSRLLNRDGGTVVTGSGPELIRRAKLAFGALLYYIGLAYRALQQQKDGDGAPLIPIKSKDDLQIYVAGRASILFRNLFDDEEDKQEFISLFRSATGQAFGTSQINFSNQPKHEVAFGLVVAGDEWDRRYDAKDRAKSVAVPAGEFFLRPGEDATKKDTAALWADMRTFDPSKPWEVSGLDGLEDFLKLARRYLRIDVKMAAGVPDSIEKIVNDINEAQRSMLIKALNENPDLGGTSATGEVMDDNVALEPPFIRAMRQILALNTEEGVVKVSIDSADGGRT
jgi:hypothetical protein